MPIAVSAPQAVLRHQTNDCLMEHARCTAAALPGQSRAHIAAHKSIMNTTKPASTHGTEAAPRSSRPTPLTVEEICMTWL